MSEYISQSALERAIAETRRQIAQHWEWYLTLGIVILLGGIAAIAFPFVSTIAAKIVLGWIFLIAGIMMIVHAFSAGEWRGFIWNLLIGILYVLAGGYLAFFPLGGILTLTFLISALFLAEGILEVIMAFRMRPHEGWVWLLASGVLAFVIGALIALQLPGSATWVLGFLVGVNLIFTGWSFIFLALAGRRFEREHVPAHA
jgi:uncharacterized membrane protein HdeD (DUF308 family)